MVNSYTAAPEIEVLTSNFQIPGYGFVPVNTFVIKGSEPILVDTGAAIESGEFMPALRSIIDPAELKWIWLTHTDFDHIGSLHQLLGHPAQDARFLRLGRSALEHVLMVAYTLRRSGDVEQIRIISARLASRKERGAYRDGAKD